MSRPLQLCFVVSVALLAACSSDGPTLRVDLKTDFVPGTEFNAVRLTIGSGDGALISDHVAAADTDYVRGARLAQAEVTSGQTPVTVTLLRGGVEVISRSASVSVGSQINVATVLITRDCEGVACPNDNPSFDSCLGGECVDPRCTVETPEFCPPPECTTDSACSVSTACVQPLCQDGVCLAVPNDANCGANERCDAQLGCVAIPSDAGSPDAGSPDAGGPDVVDAGPTNALYISPTGDDGDEGSRSAPFRTFSLALSRLTPGATLILLPGDYGADAATGYLQIDCESASTACGGAPCPSGSPGMPITIRSEDPRGAAIRMEAGESGINVLLRQCDSYVLDGLTVVGVDGAGSNVVAVYGSRNITFRGGLVATNNREQNTHLFAVNDSTNVVVEDSEFYDFHRYAITSWRSRGVTARRNYFNPRGRSDIAGGYVSGAPNTGDSAITCHHSEDCLFENNVFIGGGNNVDVRASQLNPDGEGGEGNSARILSNVFVGGIYGLVASSSCASMPECASIDERVLSDMRIENNVILGPSGNGILVRGAEGLVVRNNSIFNAGVRVDQQSTNASLPCSADIFNNLVENEEFGIVAIDQSSLSVDGNNTFPGIVSADGAGDNTVIDAQVGACRHRVPDTSPVNGTGRGGADVGARIVVRSVDGVLTAERLWNDDGTFPCGNIVPGINDGATNTCSTFSALGVGAMCAVE
ncbi:MAG: hypothetical protein AB8H86_08725 [Polyangiales bacterium]